MTLAEAFIAELEKTAAEPLKIKIDFTTGEMRGPGGNLIGRVPTQDQLGDAVMSFAKPGLLQLMREKGVLKDRAAKKEKVE